MLVIKNPVYLLIIMWQLVAGHVVFDSVAVVGSSCGKFRVDPVDTISWQRPPDAGVYVVGFSQGEDCYDVVGHTYLSTDGGVSFQHTPTPPDARNPTPHVAVGTYRRSSACVGHDNVCVCVT